ncbi:Leucine carboxyl methyltransferase 1 [Gaertneriomyces sp. JEL0708]|nr:Leucine carboxyl methyltransferase 1 [Gaertneriomyces sp. JEL0708]
MSHLSLPKGIFARPAVPRRPRSPPRPHLTGDDAIRSTDTDAAVSRLAAVSTQYLDDPFAHHFVRRPEKRPPIINRGTYTRHHALDSLIARFLKSCGGQAKQIVSLGAGSDTRWFKLKSRGLAPERYFEIDFPEITSQKIAAIQRKPELGSLLEGCTFECGGTALQAKGYAVLPGDLRQFTSHILPKMMALGFDRRLPTLFLSECLLVYLDSSVTTMLLKATAESVDVGVFLVYEQILPDDAFGRTMVQNLRARNIELPGLHAYPTMEAHEQRYKGAGWNTAGAIDLNDYWETCLEEAEKLRISKLEIFDELEEWKLLSAHYCISWGTKGQELQDFGYNR